MTEITRIRRRADGSIDSTFYIAKGRACRSVAAHELAKKTRRQARPVLLSIAALLALLPIPFRT